MYRLVLYYLVGLVFLAFVFGFFGWMPYDPAALAFSLLLILLVSVITNKVFAYVFEAATNIESVYITALILVLVITPVMATDTAGVGLLIFVSVWAMASKYIFAIGKKHIFNPVAIAIVGGAVLLNIPATWWIGGNVALLPFMVIGGLLIVRKIQRFDLVISFGIAALISVVATSSGGGYLDSVLQTILHSSVFFLAFVMLTEPLTTPPTRMLRIVYGIIVGLLFAPNIHIGTFYFTPEMALIVGNIFVYIVSPKGRFILTIKRIEKVAHDTYDFVFTSDRPFTFRPGQYMEWTLGHKYCDNRGNRRYFTIASAPTESDVRFGIKFYEPMSTLKRALAGMKDGDTISASHIAGGFVLPKNKDKKLVFIAGGIGITPFRSMIHYLLDMKERRDITLFYANRTVADIAYKDIFDRAQIELGIKTVHVISDEETVPEDMHTGFVTKEMIQNEVQDYAECVFYISGPRGMVTAFKKVLREEMGISKSRIKSDFFPGFA